MTMHSTAGRGALAGGDDHAKEDDADEHDGGGDQHLCRVGGRDVSCTSSDDALKAGSWES